MLMVMLLKPDLRNDDSRVVNAEGGVVLWHSWEFSQNRLIIAQIGQSGTPTKWAMDGYPQTYFICLVNQPVSVKSETPG